TGERAYVIHGHPVIGSGGVGGAPQLPGLATDHHDSVITSADMERISRCLSPDEVVAFMSGALGADAVRLFEGHVAVCAACRMLLSLVARSDSIVGTLPSRGVTFGGGSGAPRDAGADPSLGSRVGRYVLLERLGAGAMGVVFAAHDPELDRKV